MTTTKKCDPTLNTTTLVADGPYLLVQSTISGERWAVHTPTERSTDALHHTDVTAIEADPSLLSLLDYCEVAQ